MSNRVCSVFVKLALLSVSFTVAAPAGCGGGSGGSGAGSTGGTTSYTGGTTAYTGGASGTVGPATSLDPNWAEWPMPNSQADVTAGAPNLESYTDNADGTVTDNVTGLMWQQVVPQDTRTYADAVAYCSTLALAGHSDWRLPSVIELVSIVDCGQSVPSMDGSYFSWGIGYNPGTWGVMFWSSSPMVESPGELMWCVLFDYGDTFFEDVSSAVRVRCVR